jgi:DDE superfamily endonuclease
VLQATTQHLFEHLFLIQDGARYHTNAATRAFFAAHQERMTVFQLPSYSSYSPDYNPIEYLWRKTKKKTTHNEYFARFEELSTAVEQKLAYFAAHPVEVQGLFGRYCQETNLIPQELAVAA